MPSVTTNVPKAEQPMEMRTSEQESGSIVSQQPICEPRPKPDQPQVNMRGGGISCGFDCCDGSCRFYKNCC